jgi:hypothetical protein
MLGLVVSGLVSGQAYFTMSTAWSSEADHAICWSYFKLTICDAQSNLVRPRESPCFRRRGLQLTGATPTG